MAEPRNGDGEAESRPRRSPPRPKKAGAAKKRAVQRKRGLAAAILGYLFPAPGKPTQPPPGPPRPADLAVGAAVGLALSFLVWAASLLFGWRFALPGCLAAAYALGWACIHPGGRIAEGFGVGGHARSRTALCIVASLGLPLALAGGGGSLRLPPSPENPASTVRAPGGATLPVPRPLPADKLPVEKRGPARTAA